MWIYYLWVPVISDRECKRGDAQAVMVEKARQYWHWMPRLFTSLWTRKWKKSRTGTFMELTF